MSDDILHFEDFAAGQVFDCGVKRLSPAEIIAYARQFDPQPFHLDAEAAKDSILGGLSASGWQTCAVIMRLYYDGVLHRTAGMGSPGIADTRWRRPAMADAPLRLTVSITETRELKSRPDAGLVGFATELVDESDGARICTQKFSVFIRRRTPGAPPPPKTDAAPRAAAPENPFDAPAADGFGWIFAEDVELNRVADLGECEIAADEIVDFARQYDPQPFHLDREAGRASIFGGLAASGWHTAALWMRRLMDTRQAALARLSDADRATALSASGPGLGFTDLQWRRPVLEGDRLRFYTAAKTCEPFGRRPEWRLVRFDSGAINQKGEIALRMQNEWLIRSRA